MNKKIKQFFILYRKLKSLGSQKSNEAEKASFLKLENLSAMENADKEGFLKSLNDSHVKHFRNLVDKAQYRSGGRGKTVAPLGKKPSKSHSWKTARLHNRAVINRNKDSEMQLISPLLDKNKMIIHNSDKNAEISESNLRVLRGALHGLAKDLRKSFPKKEILSKKHINKITAMDRQFH